VTAAEIYAELSAALARQSDDESDETAAEVARLVALATDKAGAWVHVMRRAALEAEAAKASATRATARQRTAEATIARAREQVAALATLAGGRLQGDDYSASVRESVSVEISDEAAIPAVWLRTSVEPRKADILAELRAGRDVPGCALARRATLVVR